MVGLYLRKSEASSCCLLGFEASSAFNHFLGKKFFKKAIDSSRGPI